MHCEGVKAYRVDFIFIIREIQPSGPLFFKLFLFFYLRNQDAITGTSARSARCQPRRDPITHRKATEGLSSLNFEACLATLRTHRCPNSLPSRIANGNQFANGIVEKVVIIRGSRNREMNVTKNLPRPLFTINKLL